MIPEAAVEALARVLADEALFDADCGGYGWDAETDSSDHFMPSARKSAVRYLEAAAPHMADKAAETRLLAIAWTEAYGAGFQEGAGFGPTPNPYRTNQ